MEEYKKYLKSKKVVELKNIARSYIKHVKFAFTGVKKGELIDHLLKHTIMEDSIIKVIDSDVPVKVLIKGSDEDAVKKMIDESEMKMKEREKIQRLLFGQKGGFLGRIDRFKNERDELIKEDEDNLRKKHTKAIEDYNKQIEDTQKQLKVVNALIKDFKKKVEEKIEERKMMAEANK
jgi:hypothetical protein